MIASTARILHPVNCELSDTRFMPRLDLDTFDTRDTSNRRIKDFILFCLCPLASLWPRGQINNILASL